MAAHQASLSLGFSRQEHRSGLPFPSPMHESEKRKRSRSVVPDSQRPYELQPTSLLCPWDFPGKSTGVGCHCLFRSIHYINVYISNLERWWLWSYMQDRKRDTDIKNRLSASVEEGEGGMIWENSFETGILPYVKQMNSPSSMHETGHSMLVHWDNPEGWNEEGGGRGLDAWLIHVNVWQKPPQYCKVISFQL